MEQVLKDLCTPVVAKVMVARRLAVRLYWMLRNQWTYAELVRPAGEPESFRGKQ